MKVFIILSFVSAATAQTSSSTGVIGGIAGPIPGGVVSNSAWFSSIGPVIGGGAVTGAPYSAEEVTEHVQTLADGTHITQAAQTTRLYRDSQGRTRIERSFPAPPGVSQGEASGPNLIEISDPVSGVRYTLEPRNHIARKMSVPIAPPPPPPPPSSATSASSSGRFAAARVVPELSGTASQDQSQHPQRTHESLGTETIEGVSAEGKRTTVVYPTGAVGNDRPITTVSETWTSPDLKVVVLSKHSDPRNGESTTKLTNISRAEPDPSLFQIPSDYEIVDPQVAGPVR
jgi:hypothetical protein